MLLFWQIKIAHFMKEGTEKIFLSGEMAWALRGLPGCQLLSDYESELDQFLSHYPKVTVLLERLGRFLPFRRIFPVPEICIGTTGTPHRIAR